VGLFDFLFGKGGPAISDPDQLREELFATARRGDRKRLEQLARANVPTVLEHFPSWQKVPEAVRADPAAVQGYVHALVAVAEVFAERLGRPELMARLMGPPESNPLAQWQQALARARELIADLRYDQARDQLATLLESMRGSSGTGVDRYRPIALGHLAECHFHAGHAAEAVPHLEQALALCEQSGDAEGLVAYLTSLFEAHRYLGQSGAAAGYADRLASVLKPTPGAARWKTRAAIVRAGEPLNRVVAVVNGVPCEVNEAQPTGRIQFVYERNRITLQPAAVLTERGSEAAGAGRYKEALQLFEDAARADPFDPHARYLGALTLLHLKRYADAVEGYRRVEELAPGWFHCRADLWVAEHLASGGLPYEDFLILLVLQDGSVTPKEKVQLADHLLVRQPNLPSAHLHWGKCLMQLGREAEAREAFRAGLSANPDPDVRACLLVDLATTVSDAAERDALYREAADLNGNLVAAAAASLALRARP
jgi:tetratricopeptide (TPR) repeat protein